MRRTTVLEIGILLASLAVGAACDPTSDGAPCEPGATQSCVCLGAAVGVQICTDRGERWGECQCGGMDVDVDKESSVPDQTDTTDLHGADLPDVALPDVPDVGGPEVDTVCTPDCEGKVCGTDGCGGSCGECPCGTSCGLGQCVFHACDTKQCGSDGCGGSCGSCPEWTECTDEFRCLDHCMLACQGRECGGDGCGGLCGLCPNGWGCSNEGACVMQCTPDCTGRQCGSDGCGGLCGGCGSGVCGACPYGTFCNQDGVCAVECTPECEYRECGPDGCGGQCGECPEGVLCTAGGMCGSVCTQCVQSEQCTRIDFSSGNLSNWEMSAAMVLPAWGDSFPLTGGHFLKLTTGEGLTEQISWATFQTCLQPGSYSVIVTWQMYSEELKEFCGSSYVDEFSVWISGDGMDDATIVKININDICPSSECQECGSAQVDVAPSSKSLDQGDVYRTTWHDSAAVLNITEQNQRIDIHLQMKDQGDSIYDTVVLVDQIWIVPCDQVPDSVQCGQKQCGQGEEVLCLEGSCIGSTCCVPDCTDKECGDDGCGGTCGACGGCLEECIQGECISLASCAGRVCGDDGCGVSCGTCVADSPCWTPSCSAQGTCEYQFVDGCCISDAECDDGSDSCTMESCINNECAYSLLDVEGCCLTAEDCAVEDVCMSPLCGADRLCHEAPISGCCHDDSECNDGDDICTTDQCVDNKCKYTWADLDGCCTDFAYALGFDDGLDADLDIVNYFDAQQAVGGLGVFLELLGGMALLDMEMGWRVTDKCGSHTPEYALSYGVKDLLECGLTVIPACSYSVDIVGALASSGGVSPIPLDLEAMLGYVDNSGTVTTPELSLPGGQEYQIHFWIRADVSADVTKDLLELRVLDGAQTTAVWDKTMLPAGVGPGFQEVTIDLGTTYAGKTIRVQFFFDAAGTTAPVGTGLTIDDFSVKASCNP